MSAPFDASAASASNSSNGSGHSNGTESSLHDLVKKREQTSMDDTGCTAAESPISPPVAAAALEPNAEEQMKALRQALFGNRLDTYGKRLDDMETRLEKRLSELSQRVSDSFAAFEKYVRRELKSHVARLDTETEAREKHFQDSKDWMAHIEKETDATIGRIGREVRTIDENCHNDMSRKVKELQDSLQKTEMAMRNSMDNTVAALEEKMAGRSQLGELLREMGERMGEGKKASA